MKRSSRLFPIILVSILLLLFVIYIGSGITGYASKKSQDSSTSTAPSSQTSPSTTSTSSGGSSSKTEENKASEGKENSEIKKAIDKKGEVRISEISEQGEAKHEISIRDVSAVSDLSLEKKNGNVNAILSNGKRNDIAFPDVVSRIAMSESKSSKQNLEIKESGEGNDKKVIYVAESNKITKIFGLFNANYKFKIEIDAENGKVIKSQKPWWTILAKDEKDSEIEDMGLQLVQPIQDIVIIKNKKATINLDEYFLNAKSYSASKPENMALNLKGDSLTLIPNKDFIGTESITIIAYNANESLDASFNVIVSEGNLSISTKQYPAKVNEKVKWEKKIKIDKGEKTRIDLPGNSETIILTELNENDSVINNQTISRSFVDIDSNKDNANSYKINYYTSAPRIKEKITKYGKEIIVSNTADIHYTGVLAFTYLPIESYEVKLYRITENGRESIDLNKYDLNGNGLIDYVEWIVSSLSNQTYELIIEATNAEHLDSNRTLISNIYDEIRALDNTWSETIPANDYVRVVFKQPLDNSRDITLYLNVINESPYIEVYENNGTQILSQSNALVSNRYNKISLANLPEGYSQDTFDLRVVGGSIQIDYIVDPATVVLNSPADNSYSNNPVVTFNCSASDDTMLSNITLYGNWTGNWEANETKDITGVLNSTTFTKTINEGAYIWNCLVYNNESAFAWFASNYTFVIDSTSPQSLNITSPLNISYNASISSLNYTYTEINPDFCWYSTDNGVTNLSIDSCGTSFSNVSSKEGSNTWTFYMNDSAGNLNSTAITFVVDTIPPAISFGCNKVFVNIRGSLDCSCSATDAGSLNPTMSYTVNPSTGDIGTFTTLCTATDEVGNTATSQFSYNVYSTGSGLVSHWKITYILTSEILARGYTLNIGVKERIKMQINNEEHYLDVVNLTGNSATINVSSTTQQITLNVGEEKKLEITEDNYYDLLVKLNSIANNKGNFTIQSIHEEIAPAETVQTSTKPGMTILWILIPLVLLALIFFIVKKKLYRKVLGIFSRKKEENSHLRFNPTFVKEKPKRTYKRRRKRF